MNQNRFFQPLYLVLIFVLAACQTQATPTAVPPTVVPTTMPTAIPTALDLVVPTTAKVIAEWQVSEPSSIVVGFDSVWVAGHHSNTTTRIDPATNTVIAVIKGIGYRAEQALVMGNALWVTGQHDDTVWIDPETNTVTSTESPVKGEHHSIAWGFNSLWATTGDNKLDRIDPATSQIIGSILLEDESLDISNGVVATTSAVWVYQSDKAELIKVDPATNTVVSKTPWIMLINEAKAQTIVPTGKGTDFLWINVVGDEGGGGIPKGLLRIDPNTGTGLTFLPWSPDQSGDGPLTVTDDAVWYGTGGQIYRINVATNQINAIYI